VTDITATEAGQPEGLLRVDSLRLEVAPDTGADEAFQLLVYVNDVEITSAGAGLGMSR
jgi:hypothetical protein